MSKIGHFDICKAMALANMDIKMSPLDNVKNLRKVKAGTDVTIGVAGDEVAAIGIEQRYVGGLLLINAKEYFAMKQKLEAEQESLAQGGRTPDAAGKP